MQAINNKFADRSIYSASKWDPALAAIIFVTCFAAFFPSLSGGLLEWGDRTTFTDNPVFNGNFSWASAFSTTLNGEYQPLYVLLLKLLQVLGASASSPFLFHITNILLHSLTSASLLLLFRTLGMRPGVAFSAAILFAVHPLHAGAVAWVSGGNTILCALLSVLSLNAYVRFVQRANRWWLHTASVLFLLALLSGTQAIVLPLVMLATDKLLGRAWTTQKVALNEKMPLWITTAITATALLLYQMRPQAADQTVVLPSFIERLASGATIYAQWALKVLWPAPLSYHYLRPVSVPAYSYILIIAVPALLLYCVQAATKHGNALLVWSLTCYSLFILPRLGLFPTNDSFFADHHAYLAIAGLIMAGVSLVERLVISTRRAASIAVAGAGVYTALFLVLTWQQSTVWQSNEKLYEHHIKSFPDSYFGYYQAGLFHLKAAFRVEGNDNARLQHLLVSKQHFIDAWRTDSLAGQAEPATSSEILQSAGVVCGLTGEPYQAVRYFSSAIKLTPANAEAFKNRGYQYFLTKQHTLAIADYSAAIRLKPRESDLYYMRANCNYALGDIKNARTDLDKAISLGSIDPNCFIAMAVVFRAEGDTVNAVNYALKARDMGANVPEEYLH